MTRSNKKHIPAAPLPGSCLSSYFSCPTSLRNAHSLNPLLGRLGLGGRKDLQLKEGGLFGKLQPPSEPAGADLLPALGNKTASAPTAWRVHTALSGTSSMSEQGIVCAISTCFWFCSNCQETLVALL